MKRFRISAMVGAMMALTTVFPVYGISSNFIHREANFEMQLEVAPREVKIIDSKLLTQSGHVQGFLLDIPVRFIRKKPMKTAMETSLTKENFKDTFVTMIGALDRREEDNTITDNTSTDNTTTDNRNVPKDTIKAPKDAIKVNKDADYTDDTALFVTRRDNKVVGKVPLEVWNTTWYDVPIQDLTEKKMVEIWLQHEPRLANKDIQGGFYTFEGAMSARWSRVTTKEHNLNDDIEFTIEKIMAKDPHHRYVFEANYSYKDGVMNERFWTPFMRHHWQIGNNSLRGLKKIEVDQNTSISKLEIWSSQGYTFKEKRDDIFVFVKGNVSKDELLKDSIDLQDREKLEIFVKPISLSGTLFENNKHSLYDVRRFVYTYMEQLFDIDKTIIFKDIMLHVNVDFMYYTFSDSSTRYYVGITPDGNAFIGKVRSPKDLIGKDKKGQDIQDEAIEFFYK